MFTKAPGRDQTARQSGYEPSVTSDCFRGLTFHREVAVKVLRCLDPATVYKVSELHTPFSFELIMPDSVAPTP
jgi:hypothetical protein